MESNIVPDKYRASLHLEDPNVEWRYGNPPTYEIANQLFGEGRTKEWPNESPEEKVQNAIKSWHMEIVHKTKLQDFKTIIPEKFKLFVNGRDGLSGEEILRIGGFNALLKSSVPEELQYFKADRETFESTHKDFKTCFPRGFTWEVTEVYSPPPLIAFKFRHWGFFEGPYKAHPPTGELIQFYGMATLKVDCLSMKIEEFHMYYDPGELFGALFKAKTSTASESRGQHNHKDLAASIACPFSKLNYHFK
ncbi:pathogen-related protein-like [Benincasa hispida]|uniref:pathogen-related protein-like n=1 Tax=Benincasa hispida TaxID=102211 RepID=UPI00190066A6|nr:pathogen-related protein-like [Benincasa hispida]